jgi:nucleoside-diphosphate-sugar epimerase
MKILVTGGNGYVGSVLIPKLLGENYSILNIDTQWFGDFLPKHDQLRTKKIHFNELSESDFIGVEHVIHLANVANDPSVDLNQTFAWEINALHQVQLLDKCVKFANIKSFIYASSGSVYGVSENPKVTEELDLVPISTYNKTKQVAERICLSYKDKFNIHIIRPATVCGVSPRMRFDVVVNMFVLQAFKNKKIKILGGNQIRPNIHVEDMANVYLHFLKKYTLPTGFYNAGFENLSILDIANVVSSYANSEIEIFESNDPRSYRQDSSKLLSTGFSPKKKVNDAITEVLSSLENGILTDDPRFHTVDWMKQNKIGI